MVNKVIKRHLKTKLEQIGEKWLQQLPYALWVIRTTRNTTIDETPFSLTFGIEAKLLVEVSLPSYHVECFRPKDNGELIRYKLPLIKKEWLGTTTPEYDLNSSRLGILC